MRLDCDILSQRSIDSQSSWDFATNLFLKKLNSENDFRKIKRKLKEIRSNSDLEKTQQRTESTTSAKIPRTVQHQMNSTQSWVDQRSGLGLFDSPPHTWGICTRRAGKLNRARSRLYRSPILQVNMRLNSYLGPTFSSFLVRSLRQMRAKKKCKLILLNFRQT